MIKILLADDHSIVREGLKRIIEESGEMEIIAEAPDGKTAFRLAKKKKSMVLLLIFQCQVGVDLKSKLVLKNYSRMYVLII